MLLPGSAILFVGEAPGEQEEIRGQPFIGVSGHELREMLRSVGIDPRVCSFTNVFDIRPPNNDINHFFSSIQESPLLPLDRGKWLPKANHRHLDRLQAEIAKVDPVIIVTLGKTALWAVCQRTDLEAVRGTTLQAVIAPYKVIPTYHPARILRQYSLRIVSLSDFLKAKHEARDRAIHHDSSHIWIKPTIHDLQIFERTYLHSPVAADIETVGRFIRCIGFSSTPSHAIVVPFLSAAGPYWQEADEISAWAWVRHILNTYSIIFHNGAYDVSYLLRYGIIPRGYSQDTMLLHHALYPEMRKSLGFLGSLYANRPAWKKMRPRGNKPNKREE